MLFFEKKVNSFIKIRERGQSLNRSFRIHKIGTSKTDFKFTTEQIKRLNTLYSNYYGDGGGGEGGHKRYR